MARKKKHPEHVNHERWLVSYADFVTLLFAFFVVMFAVSQVDTKKLGRFTTSFAAATKWSIFDDVGGGMMPGEEPSKGTGTEKGNPPTAAAAAAPPTKGPTAAELKFQAEKRAIRGGLLRRQRELTSLQGLVVDEVNGELVLRLPERLMFEAGDAALHDEAKVALAAVADEIVRHPIRVRIEGHTDGRPIRTEKYPTNWELSTARATAVVAYFLEHTKIEPPRLAAAGYAEYHPIASNETPEGRAQNRRVDIVIAQDFVDNSDDEKASDRPSDTPADKRADKPADKLAEEPKP